MAAVYSEKGGTLQENTDALSKENEGIINVAESTPNIAEQVGKDAVDAVADSRHGGASPPKNHAEIVDLNTVPPITIKEEPMEEEEEYMQINIGEGGDESEERVSANESVCEENVDGGWHFRCVDCDEIFGDKEMYLEHRRSHTHDGPIVCLDSDAQWDDLLVSQDGGRKTLCCAICGRKFSSSRGFFSHQLKHRNQALKHGQKNSYSLGGMKRYYECEDCGKTYSTVGQFLNHRRSHKQASKSVFHQLEDLKKKAFQCPTCGRSYSRASALDAHRRCHEVKLVKPRGGVMGKAGQELSAQESSSSPSSSQEPSAQEQSDQEPSISEQPGQEPPGVEPLSENELSDHAAETSETADESQKTPFACDCGRSFRTLCGLSTHQRFSSVCSPTVTAKAVKVEAKRNFKCSHCDKQYDSPVALACHERWHKRRDLIRNSGVSLSCEECGKTFTSLTFFHKHQRLAHSEEAPAKSFLHQVCQLQKKSFECQDCGRRFSRASALQSHQLCHADVYGDLEAPAPAAAAASASASNNSTPPSPQKLYLLDKVKETNFAIGAMVYSQDTTAEDGAAELDNSVETVEYMGEENETEDLNVEVVSVTASDIGSLSDVEVEMVDPDQNPDLELVCESDVDEVEEPSPPPASPPPPPSQPHTSLTTTTLPTTLPTDNNTPTSPQHYEPKADVKIVKVNFTPLTNQNMKMKSLLRGIPQPQQKVDFECPECGRQFESAVGLRCHRLWHRGGMGKKSCVRKKVPVPTFVMKRYFFCDICGHKSYSMPAHNAHLGKHEDRTPYKSISYQLAELKKNSFKCEECGMRFSRLSALHSHQQHHNNTKKPFACPDCDKSYSNASGLYNHKKVCFPGRVVKDTPPPEPAPEVKKEPFNPKKSLLGPKAYHCKKCGKSFWSLGAFSYHKQHASCSTPKPESTAPVNGRRRKVACPICGLKFRRGLGWHMRKHKQENQELHTCGVCGKSYRMLACFLKHQLMHASAQENPPPAKSFDLQVEQVKKNSYSCEQCGKLFSRAMALQFHMKSHAVEEDIEAVAPKLEPRVRYPCPTCPRQCFTQAALYNHQKYCSKTKEDKVTEAPVADAVQKLESDSNQILPESDASSLQIPPEAQPLDLKYKCLHCDRSFAVIGALNFHKRIHLKTHTSLAKSRLARLNRVSQLTAEQKAGKYPFQCSDCGRHFSNNSALGTHRRWHTDKKFAGFLSSDEKSSLAKSVNDGPFLCNLCGKGFFYLCVLRRHQKYHPPTDKAPVEPARATDSAEPITSQSGALLSCPECDQTFQIGSQLTSHFETHHANSTALTTVKPSPSSSSFSLSSPPTSLVPASKVPPVKPTVPLKAPSSAKPTKKNNSKLKVYQCPMCPKNFPTIRGLRAHKWQVHRKPVASAVPQKPMPVPVPVPAPAPVVAETKRPALVVPALPQKPFPCPDCEKSYSSQGALYNHRKTCKNIKVQPPPKLSKPGKLPKPPKLPAAAVVKVKVEESPLVIRKPAELVSKCFFKCHKCGKAFPSEEQLKAHRDVAKARPFCCALCCRGYWTEAQLQQHLAWHDEVRKRLPTELRYRLSTSTGPMGTAKPPRPPSASPPGSPVVKNAAAAAQHLQQRVGKAANASLAPAPVLSLQKGHKCQHCGKSFLSPTALEQHQAQHKSQPPSPPPPPPPAPAPTRPSAPAQPTYHCTLCPLTFTEVRDLIDHHQECMGDKEPEEAETGPPAMDLSSMVTCIECGMSFGDETELHQHYILHAQGEY